MHNEFTMKNGCTLDMPETDVSVVDLEVEVLVILVYSNIFSYNLLII